MPNTYTQLYIHCVFAVKYRAAIIQPAWDERLRQYMSATVKNQGHKLIAINNMPDHLHLFVGLNPEQSISDLIRNIKRESSGWINSNNLTSSKFRWQEGYGAFSHNRSQIDRVVKYIINQQEHHSKTTFLDEYKKLLIKFDVDFDDRFIFKKLE